MEMLHVETQKKREFQVQDDGVIPWIFGCAFNHDQRLAPEAQVFWCVLHADLDELARLDELGFHELAMQGR
jgi:hypothetical protein